MRFVCCRYIIFTQRDLIPVELETFSSIPINSRLVHEISVKISPVACREGSNGATAPASEIPGNRKAAIIHHNNAVDCKRNENAVVVVGRLKFSAAILVNKSVTAKVRKVEIEHAASPSCHWLTATVNHLSEVMKKHGKSSIKLYVLVAVKYGIYLVYF